MKRHRKGEGVRHALLDVCGRDFYHSDKIFE